MCNPPILSPSFSSPYSPSSPSSSSSSLCSNTYLYAESVRKGTSLYRAMAELGPTANFPHPPRFFLNDDAISEEEQEDGQYSLDSCFLCKTHLHPKDDVYMYKGDVAFCSEECRQDQIEIDEAKEKRNQLKMKMKSMINFKNSSSKTQEIHVRVAGAVFAG